MTRLNKKHLIFISLVFFIFTHKVDAGVIINEVEISPTEERFVELYNNGSSSVDLTDWYIQRKTATGSSYSSLVSKTYFEGKSILPDSYFVISKVNLGNSDIVYDSLTLTDSNSIQLKDSNGDVVDKLGWGSSNDCGGTCAPAPVDGKSISKTSGGNFVVTTRSPGSINAEAENTDTSSTTNSTNDNGGSSTQTFSSSGSSSVSSSKTIPEVYKFATKIIAPKIVTAGIPFSFDQQTTGTKKEKITLGKFTWNFGDGMQKQSTTSPSFEYTYNYPGDYVLSLSYFTSALEEKPIATDRLIMKVVAPGVIISSVGDSLDPYIEIENKGSYEVALYKWILKGNIHSFVLPEGMVILPNKKLKLSPKITGFDVNDLSYIEIVDSSGQIFATYPKTSVSDSNYSYTGSEEGNVVKSSVVKNKEVKKEPEVINLNDLGASAAGAGSAAGADNNLNNKILIYLGLAGIILIGIISTFLIRRKTDYPDYVEKGISAKDMTIIE